MTKKSILTSAFVLVAALTLCVCGWYVGTWAGRQKLTRDQEAIGRGRATEMAKSANGLEIGSRFPDLLLWTPNLRESMSLRQLLPAGGVILYTSPGCPSCIEASKSFVAWLAEEGRSSDAALIIADGPADADGSADALFHSGHSIRVLVDQTQSLRVEYGVWENPALFILSGADLRLAALGVWDQNAGFTLVGPNHPAVKSDTREGGEL